MLITSEPTSLISIEGIKACEVNMYKAFVEYLVGQAHPVSTVQQRIANLAQRSPEFAFTSLAHYMTIEWLESAYHATRSA
jgi:hypothetical protein